jgi:hypothetical protein
MIMVLAYPCLKAGIPAMFMFLFFLVKCFAIQMTINSSEYLNKIKESHLTASIKLSANTVNQYQTQLWLALKWTLKWSEYSKSKRNNEFQVLKITNNLSKDPQ